MMGCDAPYLVSSALLILCLLHFGTVVSSSEQAGKILTSVSHHIAILLTQAHIFWHALLLKRSHGEIKVIFQ